MVYANKFNDVKRNGTNGYIRKEEIEGYILKQMVDLQEKKLLKLRDYQDLK